MKYQIHLSDFGDCYDNDSDNQQQQKQVYFPLINVVAKMEYEK